MHNAARLKILIFFRHLQASIGYMKVDCPSDGCEWNGPLYSTKNHLIRECRRRSVRCFNGYIGACLCSKSEVKSATFFTDGTVDQHMSTRISDNGCGGMNFAPRATNSSDTVHGQVVANNL